MHWYQERFLPWVVERACGSDLVSELRRTVVPLAQGRVLEIGFGAGNNLPFYEKDKVAGIYGVEPSDGMRRKAQQRLREAQIPVQLFGCSAEEIPLPDESIDTVLMTFTLCSISDWQTALRQMHRVLAPQGKLIFCEHGRAPEEGVRAWQDRVNPYWRRLAGGCNVNRAIPEMLVEEGFSIETLDAGYVKGAPKLAGYVYRGTAVKA